MHPICTVDQQIMPLGLSVERTVTVTIKEGKMLSSHRTDQTKWQPFADQKYRPRAKGNQSIACINTTDQQAWFVL